MTSRIGADYIARAGRLTGSPGGFAASLDRVFSKSTGIPAGLQSR
jgi:hypothetical protein